MPFNANYPWFFFLRIARLSLLIFLPTVIIILFVYRYSYKEGLIEQTTVQVREDLATLKFTFEKSGLNVATWCAQLPPGYARYSLVDREGEIRCDTKPSKVGLKLKDLTEVESAFAGNPESNVRYSDIYSSHALFATLKVSENLVLRKVVPINSMKDNLSRFDRLIFFRLLPFIVLSFLVFLYGLYEASKPLGMILSKVEKFKHDIPLQKNLRLTYRQDRWGLIEEALNEADHKLEKQELSAKTENEKNATILESINDDIIAVGPFETVMFFNKNFDKHFMREQFDHSLQLKVWHIFKDEKVLEAFREVFKTGERVSLKGLTGVSYNHPEKFFDLTVTTLKDPSGKITGALGVFYDITEFKLTEQMRVDFVANVSHEIRTPLTSIKGFTQMIQSRRDSLPPDMHLFLDKILSNTERMIHLFNDLLSLSVIESKNLLKKEIISLTGLVDTVFENLKTNYPHKKVRFEKDLKLESLEVDQRLMEQVLTNLADNACKYGGEDPSVKISSFQKDAKAYLVVADNGPGISKEHLQRIFERFYRVDSSRESSRGTGLGLSIVKHIIAKHGGRIWAESEENAGTTFIIELPLKRHVFTE